MSKIKKTVDQVELVAPAGSLEKLKYAYAYGADAVYIGWKKFNLRHMAANFTLSEIKKAVALKNKWKKKLYLTLNVFPRDQHIPGIISFLNKIRDIDIDALIVADAGIFQLCREHAPQKKIHISTQANVLNAATVRAYGKMGAGRIVLARELTLREIAAIKKKSGSMELEMFIHGALCLSYSGRCHLSSYITGRDANLGECTHSCRWNYHLVEETRPGEYFPVEFNQDGETLILNPRDLCLLFFLPRIIRSGIGSFKIEGRMKGIHYLATVIKAYRKAIDVCRTAGLSEKEYVAWAGDVFLKELLPLKNRMYSADFLARGASDLMRGTMEMSFEKKPEHLHKFSAQFIKRSRYKKQVLVFLKNKLERQDILFFKSPAQDDSGPLIVKDIFDDKDQAVDFGRAGKKVWLEFSHEELPSFDEWGIFYQKENYRE